MTLFVDDDDIESHVVGVMQGHDGIITEHLREVGGEKLGFLLSEEKEGGRLITVALRADEVGDGFGVPSVVKDELGHGRRDVG